MKINIIFILFVFFLILVLTDKELFTGIVFRDMPHKCGKMKEWKQNEQLFPIIPSIFLPNKLKYTYN